MAGQPETVAYLLPGRRSGPAEKEGRQRQQPVAIGGSRLLADRASALRTDEGEMVAPPGDGALAEIETETELAEHEQFEPNERRRPAAGARRRLDRREHAVEALVEVRIRLAF